MGRKPRCAARAPTIALLLTVLLLAGCADEASNTDASDAGAVDDASGRGDADPATAADDGGEGDVASFEAGAQADTGAKDAGNSGPIADTSGPDPADSSAGVDIAADSAGDAGSADSGSADTGAADAGPADTGDAEDPPGHVTVTANPATTGGDIAVALDGIGPVVAQSGKWGKPGAKAPLIYGPQGGYHVWVSVCLPPTTPPLAKLRVTLTLQGSGKMVLPGPTQLTTKLKQVAGIPGKLCRVAIPAFVDCGCQVAGYMMRVRAEVRVTVGGKEQLGWAETSVVPHHTKGPCKPPGDKKCSGQAP